MNHFSRLIVGLSEFHDSLLMIILHFDGDIGHGNHRGEISLIYCRFSYYTF
jgi:hypothetical protein